MLGIKKSFVLTLAMLLLPSCSLFRKQPSDDTGLEDTEAEDTPSIVLSHPETPDAFGTQALILASEQPQPEQIDRCKVYLTSLAGVIDDDASLLSSKEKLSQDISKEIPTYHWCYYQMVRNLDVDMTSSQFSFDQKGEKFFVGMKILWLLAKSLEEVTQDFRYFNYLKERYVQLNHDIFGRSMSSVAPSLDERRKSPTPRVDTKPASQ